MLTKDPVSQKLKDASAHLDLRIAHGTAFNIEAIEREAWVVHLVRLYQTDRQFSRDCLERHNERDTQRLLPNLGKSVKDRLIELGIIDKEKK